MSHQIGWIGIPLGLLCSALLSSLGFMLQTLGLKDGNTVAVCTCAAVASMSTGLRLSDRISQPLACLSSPLLLADVIP